MVYRFVSLQQRVATAYRDCFQPFENIEIQIAHIGGSHRQYLGGWISQGSSIDPGFFCSPTLCHDHFLLHPPVESFLIELEFHWAWFYHWTRVLQGSVWSSVVVIAWYSHMSCISLSLQGSIHFALICDLKIGCDSFYCIFNLTWTLAFSGFSFVSSPATCFPSIWRLVW